MQIDIDSLVRDLGAAKADALLAQKAKKAQGASDAEIALATGRYEGLREALEVVGALARQ
jgi:hypothetical protein